MISLLYNSERAYYIVGYATGLISNTTDCVAAYRRATVRTYYVLCSILGRSAMAVVVMRYGNCMHILQRRIKLRTPHVPAGPAAIEEPELASKLSRMACQINR